MIDYYDPQNDGYLPWIGMVLGGILVVYLYLMFTPIAQRPERGSYKPVVAGSTPAGRTAGNGK